MDKKKFVTPTQLKEARTNLSKVDPTHSKLTTADPTQSKLTTADPTQSKLPNADSTKSKPLTADPIKSPLPTANPTKSKLSTVDTANPKNPTLSKLVNANMTKSKLNTANPTQPNLPTANPTQPNLPTANPTQPNLPTANPTQPNLPTANPTQPNLPTANQTQPNLPTANPTQPPNQPNANPTQPPNQPNANPTQPPNLPTAHPTQHKQSSHTTEEDNYDCLVTEPLRKCYVIASLKGQSNTFAVLGDDKELSLLKVNSSQKVYTNFYHTLVNVRQDITRPSTAIKIIKAGSILKGKSFDVDMTEVNTKVKAYRIRLEGVGKDAENPTDIELKEKPETSIIEKLEAKVLWVAPKIFNNKKNVKIQTETGMPLLISLFPPHHGNIIVDKVYTFIHIEKTSNWISSSSLINDVEAKFKTTQRTEIILNQRPSKAFQNLNKSKGKVTCIDQELTLFDQCPGCFKSRNNNICIQANCFNSGIQMLPNETFLARMVITDEDNNTKTIKIWSDQMMDFPNSNLVPQDDELREVLILNDLERHYLDRVIFFKKKLHIDASEDAMTVSDVTVSADFMDIS